MKFFAVGDFVERWLSRFGITSARVEWLLRIPPDTCGCAERKSALNAWGFRVQYRIMMFLGGTAPLPWRLRWKIVKGRMARLWKTTISRLAGSGGSSGTAR